MQSKKRFFAFIAEVHPTFGEAKGEKPSAMQSKKRFFAFIAEVHPAFGEAKGGKPREKQNKLAYFLFRVTNWASHKMKPRITFFPSLWLG